VKYEVLIIKRVLALLVRCHFDMLRHSWKRLQRLFQVLVVQGLAKYRLQGFAVNVRPRGAVHIVVPLLCILVEALIERNSMRSSTRLSLKLCFGLLGSMVSLVVRKSISYGLRLLTFLVVMILLSLSSMPTSRI
jgi:hypothetical protein